MKKLIIVLQNEKEYPRNNLILKTLRTMFVTREIAGPKNVTWKNWYFFWQIVRYCRDVDTIFFLFPAQTFFPLMYLFRFLFRKQIIFDAFTSIYESAVFDRQVFHRYSIQAVKSFALDFFSGHAASMLLFDTAENQQYFCSNFLVPSKKAIILPVCVNLEIVDNITPIEELAFGGEINILFYGSYIPLQGVQYIIEAAEKLKNLTNLRFFLIGSGQTKKMIVESASERELTNIRFIDSVAYEEMIRYIKSADICLGIFGTTQKASRVIPNKIIDYLACGKTVITGANVPLERYFQDGKEIVYCARGDADDLAKKILEILARKEDYAQTGSFGRLKIEEVFSDRALRCYLKEIFSPESIYEKHR